MAAGRGGKQRLDNLRVDHRSSSRHSPDRVHEVARVPDPILEEVGAPGRALIEKRDRILGFRVLAQHDDPGRRPVLSEPVGDSQTLVAVRGRHADVGEHHLGIVLQDCSQQAVVIGASGLQIELVDGCDQRSDALPDQVVVLAEGDGYRHRPSIGGATCRWWRDPVASVASGAVGFFLRPWFDPDLSSRPGSGDARNLTPGWNPAPDEGARPVPRLQLQVPPQRVQPIGDIG
jgi:hypothetical protein